jgi:hypothetical protein
MGSSYGSSTSPSSGSDAGAPCGGTTPCPPAPCDATVTIGRVLRGNPYVPRNATTGGMPDSVPPSKTYEVQVSVTWSGSSCTGKRIDLSIINGSAENGTATVSPTQITATSVVTVTGGAQTQPGHAGKLKIQAMLGGAVTAESAGFTVCAHPLNYRDTYHSDVNGTSVGVRVSDDWDSYSGTFSDLDNTEISEVVQQGARTSPPFNPLASVVPQNSGYLSGDQRSVDTHSLPRPLAGPAGTAEKLQLTIFKCKRCGATDKVQANSGMKIVHEVFQSGTAWKHRTRKVGAAVTIGAYSTQAGSASVTSPDHNLP